jgi:hypothetical protein
MSTHALTSLIHEELQQHGAFHECRSCPFG